MADQKMSKRWTLSISGAVALVILVLLGSFLSPVFFLGLLVAVGAFAFVVALRIRQAAKRS